MPERNCLITKQHAWPAINYRVSAKGEVVQKRASRLREKDKSSKTIKETNLSVPTAGNLTFLTTETSCMAGKRPVPATLPYHVDLRPLCSRLEDQGNLNSCTGNALAGAPGVTVWASRPGLL
jgi:hypothetical protein